MLPAHEKILKKAPKGAKRVQVREDSGVLKYKSFDELEDSDVIQTKRDGIPICMTKAPGRKKKIEILPANREVAEILKKKTQVVDSDRVYLASKQEDPDQIMMSVIQTLGEEQANLSFIRQEMERKGDLIETTTVTARKVTVLKALVDAVQKQNDRNRDRSLDTETPAFHAYFKHVMNTFKEAMSSVGARPEMIETVFSKFAAMTSDPAWEAEAKARIRSAV